MSFSLPIASSLHRGVSNLDFLRAAYNAKRRQNKEEELDAEHLETE